MKHCFPLVCVNAIIYTGAFTLDGRGSDSISCSFGLRRAVGLFSGPVVVTAGRAVWIGGAILTPPGGAFFYSHAALPLLRFFLGGSGRVLCGRVWSVTFQGGSDSSQRNPRYAGLPRWRAGRFLSQLAAPSCTRGVPSHVWGWSTAPPLWGARLVKLNLGRPTSCAAGGKLWCSPALVGRDSARSPAYLALTCGPHSSLSLAKSARSRGRLHRVRLSCLSVEVCGSSDHAIPC